MKCMRLLLPIVMLIGSAFPAQAQLFGRKIRLTGIQVSELIVTARSDTDERKRLAAIEQLREHDVKTYPDIVPSLIEVMLHDPKSYVRYEAMHSLVRIRPMTQMAAQALQQTAHHDESLRLRMQTKWQVMVNGYSGSGNTPLPAPSVLTKEPPMAGGTVINPPLQPTYAPASSTIQPVYMPDQVPAANNQPAYRPLPSRPASNPPYSTAVPQQPVVPVQTPVPLPLLPQQTPVVPSGPQQTPSAPPSDEPVNIPVTPPR